MIALALIAVVALGYAMHSAAHGDWRALDLAGALLAIYGAAFVGEWVLTRRLSLHRPAELRVERRGRQS